MTAEPRPSSSLCLVTDGAAGIELLMAQRTRTARFMPGAWVFPGGVVDDLDFSDTAAESLSGAVIPEHAAWVAAALRETVEETGVWLADPPFSVAPGERGSSTEIYERAAAGNRFDAARLTYFANWITPADLPVRFDTRFYLADVRHAIGGSADLREMDDVAWLPVGEAVADGAAGRRSVPFPTLKTLEWFSTFATASDLVAWARALDAVPVTLPRMRLGDETLEIVLPWDAGYDDLSDPPVDALETATTVRGVDGSPVAEFGPSADGGSA